MPIIFSLVILFCLWIQYERFKTNRIQNKINTAFWEREHSANAARKKDISNLAYITIDLSKLPLESSDDPILQKFHADFLSLSKKKIINLSHLTNTDIKLTYGIANFQTLCECDENYYKVIRLLTEWGTYLYETNQLKNSKQVLEYAVDIGCDLNACHHILAQVNERLQGENSLKTQDIVYN